MTTATKHEAAIEVSGLGCTYGDFHAVRDLNLTVPTGELFALLGTNGAGKTTAMETIEGHRKADTGKVSVLGLDPIADRQRLRPRIGMMLQESGFANDLSVRETLDLWLSMSAGEHARKPQRSFTIDNALERVDLTDRAQTRVVQLSGGQKRRLDLALATVNRPEVLFLDEPTTGLDPESRERTWELIADLQRDGSTIVLTTHYLEEAERLADRIAIMHAGQIATEGTLRELVGGTFSRIGFRQPDRLDTPDVEREVRTAVDPASIRISQGARFELEVSDAHLSMRRLLDWADSRQLRIDDLTVSRGSLMDVFNSISSSPESQEIR